MSSIAQTLSSEIKVANDDDEQADLAEYIAAMADKLTLMATVAGLPVAGYYLALAALEARSALASIESEASRTH
jgi:hypothetical protein